MKKYKVFLCGLFLFGIAHAQYTVLHNFIDTNGYPTGNVTLVGKVLYGMTDFGIGSTPYRCSIFSMDTDGNNYKILHEFDSVSGFILYSFCSLTYSSGVLYGMTSENGAHNGGNVFSIDTDGRNYKDLFDFDSTNGEFPGGSLTLSGKKLYGMTSWGAFGYGSVFVIDTDGTGYKDLYKFQGIGNGFESYGSLTLSGGKLYGMGSGGGPFGGNIFSVDTNGKGFKVLYEFNNTTDGSPYGSLLLSKGVLYGMASGTGQQQGGSGNIFSIDTDGSRYKNLFEFNARNGKQPYGSLILSGNTLYGMTSFSIFSIDTNGNEFKDMFYLYVNSVYGSGPLGSLTLSGGVLYGMTQSGGTNNYGVIFKIDTSTLAGINNLSANKENIKVYPNPTAQNISVRVDLSQTQDVEFILYNAMGEEIYAQKLLQQSGTIIQQIDLSTFPNGIYLLRVNEGNKYMTKKIVKQN